MNSDIILCHPSYLPSPAQDGGPESGTDLSPGHTASGTTVSPWLGFFSTPSCDEAGSQLAADVWGTETRGGEDPPCLLRGQCPALWNTAVGQTKSFQPTWWRGEGGGTAAGLFPFTERSQCPRLCLTAFTCISSLAVHRNGSRSYYPHFSDEETEALKAWHLLKVTQLGL